MERKPRNLTLLRIDDWLAQQEMTRRESDLPIDHRPRHIDSVEFGEVVNIGSWRDATAFWSAFDSNTRVDLIVADVRFDDATSPLSFVDGEPQILPTGISHFKPFAAISRAMGAPIGVAVHTYTPEAWETKLTLTDDPVQQTLARLAAHEIGELASILGQAPDFAQLDHDATFKFCWNWLYYNCEEDFPNAFPKALSNFRRRLASTFVAPVQWTLIAQWCRQMTEAPRPIVPSDVEDKNTPSDAVADPGFSFYLADGTSQTISLCSLFADVVAQNPEFSFEFDKLPAHCFTLRDDPEFYELDSEGLPKIGALVQACSNAQELYQRVLEILSYFPMSELSPQLTLSELERDRRMAGIELGLVILFKYIQQQYEIQRAWENAFERFEWDEGLDQFTGLDAEKSGTLKQHLAAIASRCGRPGATRSLEDIVEAVPRITRPTIIRCVNMLVAMGNLEYDASENEYHVRSGYSGAAPAVPPDFNETDKLKSLGLSEPTILRPRQFLNTVFGIQPRDDYNMLAGKVQKAFGLPDRKAGRAFLDQFLDEGRMLPVLRVFCRQYATNALNWTVENTWPLALKEL